jgi:organic radical activating enzyme
VRTVTININRRCPLRCKHCSIGFSDTYHGSDTDLNAEKLESIIREIDTSIYGMILMAGGEPSLNPSLIRAGIAASRGAGVLSAIVTAPIWAPSGAKACGFLDKIPGLDVLILSYDDYHLEFLEWGHYRNAALEAMKRRIGLVIQIAFTREDQKQRLIRSLKGLAVLAQVNPMRTVMIGNAVENHLDGEYIQVSEVTDLDQIPRGCVLGNSFIDEKLGVHGCCWSTAAQASPFSVPTVPGDPSLSSAFRKLEGNPVFQAVRHRGFLDALTDQGRGSVVAAVRGESFSSECEICMRLMKYETRHVWDVCEVPVRELP